MKLKTLFIVALGVTFLTTSCRRQGCTDPMSLTYSSKAKKDDGSCLYEGSVVFYNDQSTSTSAMNAGVTNFYYYIDGTLIGSQAANIYFSGTNPDCDQTGLVSFTKDLGGFETQSANYSVRDQDGFVLWSGSLNFNKNTCLKFNLIW